MRWPTGSPSTLQREAAAGGADDDVAQRDERRAVERGLDQRRAGRRCPHSALARPRGARVERAGLRHAVVGLVEAAAVEHEVERAGLLDAQRGRVRRPRAAGCGARAWRGGSPSRGLEAHPVAELEQERVVAVRVVDVLERGADHVPAAGHQHRVDRRLLVGDRDGERGDVRARGLAARARAGARRCRPSSAGRRSRARRPGTAPRRAAPRSARGSSPVASATSSVSRPP